MDYPPTPMSSASDRANKAHHHYQTSNHINILHDVEMKQQCSKSLLANVLDINDDFRHNNCGPLLGGGGVGSSSTIPPNSTLLRTVFRYVTIFGRFFYLTLRREGWLGRLGKKVERSPILVKCMKLIVAFSIQFYWRWKWHSRWNSPYVSYTKSTSTRWLWTTRNIKGTSFHHWSGKWFAKFL